MPTESEQSKPQTAENDTVADHKSPPAETPKAAPVEPVNYSYICSVLPNKESLPEEIYISMRRLEEIYKMPVLMFMHSDMSPDGEAEITQEQFIGFKDFAGNQCVKTGCAVLIHSPGGDPHAAYRLAVLLRKHYGRFLALIPVMAKSAATLFAFGADDIHLARHAELGPLDMQIHEPAERDHKFSALEEVQALEALHENALECVVSTTKTLKREFKKKYDVLLPMALDFVAKLWGPMFQKIDVVHWTKMARQLRIGEEYAERLLKRKYGVLAAYIAQAFVKNYPDHDFVIEYTEAGRVLEPIAEQPVGLRTKIMNPEAVELAEGIIDFLNKSSLPNLLGRVIQIEQKDNPALT